MGTAAFRHAIPAAFVAAALFGTHGVPAVSAQQGGAGRGGFVAYPQRPPGNPAAIERGKTLWGVNCTFCHGPDARGGDGWQTGVPFNITNAAARANTGGADRPNLVGNPELENREITRYFDTSAFQQQPVNTIGDQIVPRNLLHGPSQKRLDMSVFKDVPLRGTARLQLRMEVYNVTNTPSFGNPNGQLGNAAFGTITNTIGTPRQMQFAAKLLF